MARQEAAAWTNGFVGVAIFSASLPATRLAVLGLDPWFVTAGRAAVAGVLAVLALRFLSRPLPRREEWHGLLIVAAGVVLGFPLLSALALVYVPSSHAMPFIGLLPLATAGFAVLRGGERPGRVFWVFAGLGAVAVVLYAMLAGGVRLQLADILMLLAVLVCGLGYAEGARLSRGMGSMAVISWALVLSLPFSVPFALWLWPPEHGPVEWSSWAGFAYVSVFSMFVGFLFWYRGLSLGGSARIGQLQLLQSFMGLAISALVMGEMVSGYTWLVAGSVALCVFFARRFA